MKKINSPHIRNPRFIQWKRENSCLKEENKKKKEKKEKQPTLRQSNCADLLDPGGQAVGNLVGLPRLVNALGDPGSAGGGQVLRGIDAQRAKATVLREGQGGEVGGLIHGLHADQDMEEDQHADAEQEGEETGAQSVLLPPPPSAAHQVHPHH